MIKRWLIFVSREARVSAKREVKEMRECVLGPVPDQHQHAADAPVPAQSSDVNGCFRISATEASDLEAVFSVDEIWNALNECACNKAPGPDDFNIRFFKKFWAIIRDDLVEVVNNFWSTGEFSKGCSSSFITLIPKKTDPVSLNEYRPISLIGSFYKIIAKLLSIRIRKVIPDLVGFEQSAFILDGALIANESYEFLKNNRVKSIIFKVDFEKAFDSLKWGFLDDMMNFMGFGSKWRGWIKSCLKTASISVLVNGSPTKEFNLERGVRQGDPRSPFLFIIAAEGLYWLTKSAVSNNLFWGVEIGKDKNPLSHLQYADDTIFFVKWSLDNTVNHMKLLKCFELCSGLKANYNKSNLFGIGVDKKDIENMANIISCKVGSFPFIYLGLPIGARMNRLESWKPVIDKFEKRLADWKARSMSFGCRLTLVKSVLNSLPLYYFSLFRAPPYVLKKLECVRRKFFWGGSGDVSKVSWVKWDDVIRPWADGRLNIGSLDCKNLALIGKWWWRFFTELTSLWASVIKSIYGASGSLSLGWADSSPYANSIWSKIVKAGCEIDGKGVEFTKSFAKSIGNGTCTNFWDDIWIIDRPLKEMFKRLVRLDSNADALVADRVVWNGQNCVPRWNRRITGRTIGELAELESLISSTYMNPVKADQWVWRLCGSDRFSTHSLSNLLMSKCYPTNSSNIVTQKNAFVPKKVGVFVWRARRERLPVLLELDKRGIDLHSILCPICGDIVESVENALFSCKKAHEVWCKVLKWWGIDPVQHSRLSLDGLLDINLSFSDVGKKIWQATVWTSVYLIWKNRNQKVFKNSCWSLPVALKDIQVLSYDWIAKRCKVKKFEWHDWLHNPIWSCNLFVYFV
ncbi:uncharacterized protein [Rutidosis leptorrhynchoides]|uniref:uncharacterized protein n=1 Tax=Rutidosis leptorrhynchoides TaxID=125765 RepID=UPI003A99BF28